MIEDTLYDRSSLPAREPLRWPGTARLAVVVLLCLEAVEWQPHEAVAPPAARGAVYPRAFDPTVLSLHEYGNRVGVFRVLDVLDRLGVPGTAAVDALLAETRPAVVRECAARGFAFAGRGESASRMVTELTTAEEERAGIERCLTAVERVTGARPAGWFSTGYGESTRTLGLLAAAGVRYVCDWANDEQPYAIGPAPQTLVSLPAAVDLDDEVVLRLRSVPVGRWERMVTEACARLVSDGAESGRLLVLPLHPYLVGQPFRIGSLERALATVAGTSGVWLTTADGVVAHVAGSLTTDTGTS